MYLPSPTILGLVFVAFETTLLMRRRAGNNTRWKDRHSLPMIWIVAAGAVALGVTLTATCPQLALPDAGALYPIGVLLFAAGLALRSYAIVYLGRWFTVNVSIGDDHRLIDRGPYSCIRHPSYSGALLAFLGLTVCMGNAGALIVMMSAISAVLTWRIHLEEQALASAFGTQWNAYAARTRRLIPGLY